MSFIDVFGGSTVQPSGVSFSAVALTDSILTYWPPYATTGQVMSRIMKVNASVASKTITMPQATLVGAGQDALFDGVGAESFQVLDYDGGVIATVAPGEVKYLYLSDNSTDAGTWRVTVFGVGSSALDAAQLAGYGLSAIGTTINAAPPVSIIGGDATVVLADRATVFVWTGGSGTLTLPTTSGSTSDFVIQVRNQGTGTVTLAPVGGVLIDGSANITLSVQESCFVHMGATDWYTVGRGRNTAFNFTQLTKTITGGTTTLSLTEASNVVQKYNGALVSNATVVLPAVVQVYYVSNETSGLFTVTFNCAAGGSTVQVTQNQAAILFCDGTNIVNANTSLQGGITTLQFGAGSVTAPSVAFNEVGTGFYQSGTHKIGVTINGVSLGEFSSTGFNGPVSGSTGSFTTLTSSSTTTLNGTTIPASSTLLTTLTGAPINNPTFTGSVNAPTPALLDDSTLVATTAWVQDTVPAAVVTYYTSNVPPSVSAAYAPLASPALTGVPTAPTAVVGTSTTQLATTEFVGATAFSAALPAQAGNAGKYVTTDGVNASWQDVPEQVPPESLLFMNVGVI
jgi:hypothetical protein